MKGLNMGKMFLFLAEGFEEIEALCVVDICRRAGLELTTVSITGKREVMGSHHIPVLADALFEETDFTDPGMLILPGGGSGTTNLEACEPLTSLLKKANSENRYISAICAAPRILGKLGFLKGQKACCYPGFEDCLEGAQVVEEAAVVSGNFITGRGMGCTMEFAFAIVERMADKKKMEEVRDKIMYPYN